MFEEFLYLSLYQLSGKETPKEFVLKTISTHGWWIFYLYPLSIDQTKFEQFPWVEKKLAQLFQCQQHASPQTPFSVSHEVFSILSSARASEASGIYPKEFSNPLCVSPFLSSSCLLNNLVSQNLTQLPNFLYEQSIISFSLWLYFRCIG